MFLIDSTCLSAKMGNWNLFLVPQILSVVSASPLERSGFNPYERTITDVSELDNGFPIDYRYNETAECLVKRGEEGLPSAPGCPQSIVGIPFVYYGSPPRCYLSGREHPCKDDEKLSIQIGSPYGICACACLEDEDESGLDPTHLQFCKLTNVYVKDIDFVFDPKEKACYRLRDGQGPCKSSDEWLVRVEGRSGPSIKCERCSEFLKSPEDRCPVTTAVSYGLATSIQGNDCEPGTKRSTVSGFGGCVKKATMFRSGAIG